MRLAAPKPINPRIIVAPAIPISRAFKMIASYKGLPCQRSDSPMKIRSSCPSSEIFMCTPLRDASNQLRDSHAQPNRGQSENDAPRGVYNASPDLTVSHQGICLKRE